MGVGLDEFWKLTPHTLYLIAEGYSMAFKRQFERDNVIAHIQGAYFLEALIASVGNMFSGKSSKKHEYPDKPYDLNLDGDKQKREEESKLELFTAQLTTAMKNFNLNLSNSKEIEITQGQE